jgi:FkbM family methyltransferase
MYTVRDEKLGIVIDCYEDKEALKHLQYIFYEIGHGCYDHYSVAGLDVVDVGAYLGETAVLFSKHGARNVYAIEPFYSYFYISKNAEKNNCTNIVPIRAAVGIDGNVFIDNTFKNAGDATIGSHSIEPEMLTGVSATIAEVPGVTLADLVSKYDLKNAVLKMDCEGSEYKAIFDSSLETLLAFRYIMMECHKTPNHQPAEMELYLKMMGFNVISMKEDDNNSFIYAQT